MVKIEGHGVVLLKKETLDASLPSMIGTPVIIRHQDVTKNNADKLRCGTIANAYFNEPDGWYYCEGIIWDEDAQELIENQGWSVSCSYDFLSYNDEGGVENNIPYDKEFTQLNFTHLAIVDNPRYERANIVFNSKEENGRWVTIKGTHVFIPEGKTLDEVIEEKGWGDKENKQSDRDRIKIADLKSRENEVLKQFYEAKEGSSEREHLQYELDALKDERFRLEDKQSDTKDKQEEPEWLKQERKKLDRQTTQMYEDRYSTEHPNLEKAKGYSLSDKYKNHIQFEDDKESGGYPRKIYKDLESAKEFYKFKKEGQEGAEKENLKRSGKRGVALRDNPVIVKNPIGEGYIVATLGLAQKHNLEEVYPVNRTNNSKEQDMAILEELKKLIFKVENSKENDMEIDERIDNEAVDKRKLIDEVAGIMKSAGCDDEDIRTAIGKMEKIGYDKSEAGSADNKKVKNEEPDKKDDKKVENEDDKDEKEAKDLKDDMKKDVDNKCKNSKEESTFDKINAIYNSIKLVKEKSKYTSRQEKLDAAKEYFS